MRRVLNTPDFRAGFAEMLPPVSASFRSGSCAASVPPRAGADVLVALGMSAIIFSGAAQILASQLLAAGSPLAVVILTCFVLGLRFLMYSAAMAPICSTLSAPWQRALAFLLTDQAFAASIRVSTRMTIRAAARCISSAAGWRCGAAGRSTTWSASSPAT